MGATKKPAIRLLWLLLAVGIVAALVIDTASQRLGPPDTYEELKAMPEASLLLSGSDVIDDGGRDGHSIPTGTVSAAAWQLVGVNATADRVEQFYVHELGVRGWVEDTHTSSGIRATGESTARAWSKDCVIFRLGIRDPESRFADPALFGRYESVYDARVIADRRCA